jgi:enoyl-CoA hydratase/carnithine racemase
MLTINRPDRRNALADRVVEELLRGLDRAGSDGDVRCVVMTGAGDPAFCSGGDLAETMSQAEGRFVQHQRRGPRFKGS